jgi:hypothetical protein
MQREACGIKHGLGGQLCCRKTGHDGLCRSRSERAASDGSITHSEWESADGKFLRHCRYVTTYPKNAVRGN